MLNTKHLSEQEVAQCADAINGNAFNSLPEELREHLSHCDDCASEVLSVTDIAFDFSATNKDGSVLKLSTGKKIAFFTSAAAVLIIAAIYITAQFTFLGSTGRQLATSDSTISQSHDSLLIAKNKEIHTVQLNQSIEDTSQNPTTDKVNSSDQLANYQPNSEMEKLFDNNASAYRGDDITVISDRTVKVPGNDSLKWSNPTKEILNVDIFNNQAQRIQTLRSSEKGIKIPDLSNGLYYWKLINQDFDLLFVGKIIVTKK